MSVNIDLKSINELKRKAKAIKEEVSVYDIGFEAPSKKKSQTTQVFAVSAEKNRRYSAFIESNQSIDDENGIETQQEKNQNQNGSMLNLTFGNKRSSTLQSTTQFRHSSPIDVIVIPSTQTKNLLVESESDPTTIQLNADESEDVPIIQTLSSIELENAIEPLLFRNGYFKVISQQGLFVDAMCVICGFDDKYGTK